MSVIRGKNGSNPYLYFSSISSQNFNVLDGQAQELYGFPKVAPTEDGQVIAFNTDGTSEFVGNPLPSGNSLIRDDSITTPNAGALVLSDGITPFGTITDNALKYVVSGGENILSVGAAQVISLNNNMKLESTDYILTNKDFYVESGTDVQRHLTVGCSNQPDNVKSYVDITTNDYIVDNQINTKTQFKGASEYYFDNNINIGDLSTSKTLNLNGVPITPSTGGITSGMLRALNINQIVPTVAKTYNIVWSNLTAGEQAIWSGGSEAPAQTISGEGWNFTKTSATGTKINWTLNFDFLTANLKFQDLLSVYAIVRFNNLTSLNAEGYLWFQIESQNTPQNAPLYRTRWNYANSATPMSITGNTFKIYATDAIPASTAGSNTGKGQEAYPFQTKFKSNPVDVEPTSLFSIPFSKFVLSPSGDTTFSYTSANVQSIALNSASNINTYNFDVMAIGFNDVRYNLFFA
jgi:hypothetical protein